MGDENADDAENARKDYRTLQRKARDLSNSVRNRSF